MNDGSSKTHGKDWWMHRDTWMYMQSSRSCLCGAAAEDMTGQCAAVILSFTQYVHTYQDSRTWSQYVDY